MAGMPSGGMAAMLQKLMSMFGSSGGGGGFTTPGAFSSGGTPAMGDINSALGSNPLLSSLQGQVSQVSGPASPAPAASAPPMSAPTPTSQKPGESAINTGLQIGSMIPGPQQPFVAAASALAPTVEGLFGKGGGGAAPAPTPYQPKPVAPMNLPTLSAPPALSSMQPLPSIGGSGIGGGNQSLSQLIQSIMGMKGMA